MSIQEIIAIIHVDGNDVDEVNAELVQFLQANIACRHFHTEFVHPGRYNAIMKVLVGIRKPEAIRLLIDAVERMVEQDPQKFQALKTILNQLNDDQVRPDC